MTRLGIELMGISEMRRLVIGLFTVENYKDIRKTNILRELRSKYPINYKSVLLIIDKNLEIQLNSTPIALNIIQVYAPTIDGSNGEIEQFYELLTNT